MVQPSCFDRWQKTALICRYASVKHSTRSIQIYTQVIITTKCSPPCPPSFLQPFQLPHAACFIALICGCRAAVWFYSSCCVSSWGWLYFGGRQSDLCVDRSSLYANLLKFIKTCGSHLSKGAINDRLGSSFSDTPAKNSNHGDPAIAWRRARSAHLGVSTVVWWLWVSCLRTPLSFIWVSCSRIPLSLLWSSSVLLA